jgi:sulfur-oxidizing protein SoxX
MPMPGTRRSPPTRSVERVVLAALLTVSAQANGATLPPYVVQGDAIPVPLVASVPDPVRGRKVVLDRTVGACVLCHAGPFPEERVQSDIGPDLTGVGDRLSPGQLRLRLVDPQRLDPDSIMPATYRPDGLARVAAAWRGRPVLSAQQIEDVVAYLSTLHAP